MFWDLSRDVFLEVQNKRSSLILDLIDYTVYGLHSCYKINIFKEICRKPISQHPGLGSSLDQGLASSLVLLFRLGGVCEPMEHSSSAAAAEQAGDFVLAST